MARFARGQFLGEGELQFLDSGLRLEVGPRTQKRTLQRLSEWLEKERLLADVNPVRQLIHSLMGSKDTLVRRCSNKALALINHPDDFRYFVDRLRVEEDAEAQTWAVAGLVRHADGRDLRELRAMAGLPDTAAVTLAARLYAPDSWITRNTEQPVMRDNTRKNPEAMAAVGAAISRVSVDAPSPRLRQRLAILGWLPRDPADDAVWQLDEPVDLAEGDNYLVSDFVAKYYAEGMNLLFAPDDGMFSGAAFHVARGWNAPPAELRSRVRLLAERVWVAQAIIAPRVPLAPYAAAVDRAMPKENAARTRAGLPALAAPALSTLGRWLREFHARHWDRAGVGPRWRGHESDVIDAGGDASASSGDDSSGDPARHGGARRAGAAVQARPPQKPRAARAAMVMGRIREAAREGGRWQEIELRGGGTGRIWVVDLNDGMEAWFTTRFSGVQMTFEPSGYDDAVLMQRMPPPPPDDAVVDLYLEGVGTVLSVATRGGVDQVVGMTPGPW